MQHISSKLPQIKLIMIFPFICKILKHWHFRKTDTKKFDFLLRGKMSNLKDSQKTFINRLIDNF